MARAPGDTKCERGEITTVHPDYFTASAFILARPSFILSPCVDPRRPLLARRAADNSGLRATNERIIVGSSGRRHARCGVSGGAVRRHRRRRLARRFGRGGRGLSGEFGGDAASRFAAGFAFGAVRLGRLDRAALGPLQSVCAAGFGGVVRALVRRIIFIIFAERVEFGILERAHARINVAARVGDLARAVAGALGRAPA